MDENRDTMVTWILQLNEPEQGNSDHVGEGAAFHQGENNEDVGIQEQPKSVSAK